MKNTLFDAGDILSRNVPDFRRYNFSESVRLEYVSQNLCEMTGFSKDELLSKDRDVYASLVHPDDIMLYNGLVDGVKLKEQTLCAQYRLVKKDGTVIYVKDTMTSERAEDGSLVGYSVLTDITDVKSENDNLNFLNKTIPCGFIKYTCEKQPRVTYINSKMIEILGIPKAVDGEI